jgi:pimeloyl-ACP methyl ester carboxylesterase
MTGVRMTSIEEANMERVRLWELTWNTDAMRMVDECYAPDCEASDMMHGLTFHGREELREVERQILATDGTRRMKITKMVPCGDTVAIALLDTITTGWPRFVDYYYWFMVPGLAERFFEAHSDDFIRTIIGRRGARPLPPPLECPFNMPPELLAAREWADDSDVEAYAAPYRDPAEISATCNYYRSMSFHRVLVDPTLPNGERYEAVSHEEMAAAWLGGTAGGEYLDYAIEDRHKTYDGPTLWTSSSAVKNAARADDPAMSSFARHFPDLRVVPIESGHFICEEAPTATAEALRAFLATPAC